MKVCILLPVYNDWGCLPRLLSELDGSLSTMDAFASIVILNDGGASYESSEFLDRDYDRISEFRMIELVRNVGNQNALAIGLSFIRDQIVCDAVIIMDSDGQDSPVDVNRLLAAHRDHPADLITAERSGRSEGWLFRICYRIYRWTFMALTGKSLSFGNFSVIPYQHLARLCVMTELPINFAAGLIKSRIPIHCVPCYRGARYDGVTSQNFVNLIVHGINGVSVFSEIALVRVSLYSVFVIFLTLVGIAAVAAIRLFTDLAVAGWATNVVGFLLILMCQALLFSLIAIILRVQRPMSLVIEPNSYKLAIASITVVKSGHKVRAMA
jgi:glycosyltransferase involved in cell wall biosynthesis